MKIDITGELVFKTARSGGSGGQNVNKVETMVEGRWHVAESALVNAQQKELITQKLANKITADGFLLVKSQADRSQLGNKALVIDKINELVNAALVKKKMRIATQPNKAAKENRIEAKKKQAQSKAARQKINPRNY